MGIRESNSFTESSYIDTNDVLDSLKRDSLEIKDTKLRDSVLQICIDKFNIGNLDGAITTMKDAIAQYKESVPSKDNQTINDIIHPCRYQFDETYAVIVEDNNVVVYGVFDNETGGYLVDDRYNYVTYSELLDLLNTRSLVIKGATFGTKLKESLDKRRLVYNLDREQCLVLANISFNGEHYNPDVVTVIWSTSDLETDVKDYCTNLNVDLVSYYGVIVDTSYTRTVIHLPGVE